MSEKPLDPHDLSNPYNGWHIYDRSPSGILRMIRRLTEMAKYDLQTFRFAEAVEQLQQVKRLSDIFQTELEKLPAEAVLKELSRRWVVKEHMYEIGKGPLTKIEDTAIVYLEQP